MKSVPLKGVVSSRYALKMRAVVRYRHIPCRWVLRGWEWDDLPEATVPVIPVIGFHRDDNARARVYGILSVAGCDPLVA